MKFFVYALLGLVCVETSRVEATRLPTDTMLIQVDKNDVCDGFAFRDGAEDVENHWKKVGKNSGGRVTEDEFVSYFERAYCLRQESCCRVQVRSSTAPTWNTSRIFSTQAGPWCPTRTKVKDQSQEPTNSRRRRPLLQSSCKIAFWVLQRGPVRAKKADSVAPNDPAPFSAPGYKKTELRMYYFMIKHQFIFNL